MRFVEFLTEGLAKKTYRNRRVLPIDATWARQEFKRVDEKGSASWLIDTSAADILGLAPAKRTDKPITRRREVALIDLAQANKDKYGWTNEDGYMVVWQEDKDEMREVNLDDYA
jgi:hypothetical protein